MSAQYIYNDAGDFVGVYDGPGIHPNSTLIAPPHVEHGATPRFVDGGWNTAAAYPPLTPMSVYMAFTSDERIAIQKSVDPYVVDFWKMYQLSVTLNKPTDPNLVSVQRALAYLAQPATANPPGAGILAAPERIEQIRLGIPQ